MRKIGVFFLFFFLFPVLLLGQSQADSNFFSNSHHIDILRAIAGKFPGVQITATGGISGSGTNAIIRGYTSITGRNEPMIIVDGIRFEGTTHYKSGMFFGGGSLTTPTRTLDLHPGSIERIELLNGLESTIRYGEEARNGVILISTKNRARTSLKPLSVAYKQSLYSTRLSSRPDYQNRFGHGFDNQFGWFFSSWGPEYATATDAQFGSDFQGRDSDGTVLIDHPLAQYEFNRETFPEFITASYRFEPKQSPIESFFRNGLGNHTMLNISGTRKDIDFTAVYSSTAERGFTPGNEVERTTLGLSVAYPVIPSVKGNTVFNLSFTDVLSPPLSASGGSGSLAPNGTTSVFSHVFYTPRSMDLAIPYEDPENGRSTYYRPGNDIPHPLWTANNAGVANGVNRIYGKTELEVAVSSALKILYRYSFDGIDENQEYMQNPGGVIPIPFRSGYYQTQQINQTVLEQLVLISLNEQVNDVEVRGVFGAHYSSKQRQESGLESQNMIEIGRFEHSNFREQRTYSSFTNQFYEWDFERRTMSVFGSLKTSYQQKVYVESGLRAEWNQSLYQQNLSALYPAIAVGIHPFSWMKTTGDKLNRLTIEAGISTSGRTRLTDQEIRIQNLINVLVNDDLKPERLTERELRVEGSFFKNRLMLNSSVYNRSMSDLLLIIGLNPNSGFSNELQNTASLEMKGFEAQLTTIPILRTSFRWELSAGFHTTATDVKRIGEFTDAVQIGSGTAQLGNIALKDEPFMMMYGSTLLRVTDRIQAENEAFRNVAVGTPIIDNAGNYIPDQIDLIGNPVPDWNLSVIQTMQFKSIRASVQVDYQQGGDMYSTWISALMARGVTTTTTKNGRTETYTLQGVGVDGSPNTIEIDAQQYYFTNLGFGPDELRVYDMTHLRIANVSISYELPSRWLEKAGVEEVIISASVDNFWLKMYKIPDGLGFDPNVNSSGAGVNSLGFEHLTGPGARRMGGSVSIRF